MAKDVRYGEYVSHRIMTPIFGRMSTQKAILIIGIAGAFLYYMLVIRRRRA